MCWSPESQFSGTVTHKLMGTNKVFLLITISDCTIDGLVTSLWPNIIPEWAVRSVIAELYRLPQPLK